ncbi:MAG TPA: hypothetical protein VES68_03310 [Candidatus Sulfotelmatobacter sp.]|nr:hypothetical protein [Candidatus Sulfotelmatobacter sp.]
MSEGQNKDSKDPEIIQHEATTLSSLIRRNLDGEFAEVFASGDEIGLPSAEDTLIDSNHNILGNLLAERIIRPESKDLVLTFISENNPNLIAETVRFRIPRYKGVSPYYEYSKVLSDSTSPEPLRNNLQAQEAIKDFATKVGQMLGVLPKSV